MESESRTGAGHTSPWLNVGHAVANSSHGPGTAVSGTLRLIQPAANRLNGGKEPITLYLANDIAHKIRARLGLLQQSFSRKLEGSALCPGRNHRGRHTHQ